MFISYRPSCSNHKRKLPQAIRFYKDVILDKVVILNNAPIYLMKFAITTTLKRLKWDKTKRLLNGSLLLLTSDKFQTIYFATVIRRDEKQLVNGIIGITWEGNKPPDLYGNIKFLMVECEVYFESYRWVVVASYK